MKMFIKRLVWKYKYARFMELCPQYGFILGWKSAGIVLHEFEDAIDENPVSCAYEELCAGQ